MYQGLANLLAQALSWLPEEETEAKLQAMEDGRGRFLWEPDRRIVIEIDGERFVDVHLYEALAASLWPPERDYEPQPQPA
jgi:hypothetical protein